MPLTRAFKTGNVQAVRIPAENAYEDMGVDLNITRTGDVITIVPVRSSMREVVEKLRSMPKPDQIEAYEPIQLPHRE